MICCSGPKKVVYDFFGPLHIRVRLWSFILLFSPSGWCAAPAQRAIFSAAVSYLFIMISVRTIISKSTRPSLVNFQGRQNVAVDDQCEMFFDLSRDVSMATNFADFIHILRRCFFCGFIYRTDLLDAMWFLAQPGGLTLGLSGI